MAKLSYTEKLTKQWQKQIDKTMKQFEPRGCCAGAPSNIKDKK